MPYGHYHYQCCDDCGVGVLTRAINGTAVLCKDCRREHIAERNQRYNSRRPSFHKSDMFVVILHDPIPVCDGGFRAGASISIESLKVGLRFHNFTPGTEFEVRGCKKILTKYDELVDE